MSACPGTLSTSRRNGRKTDLLLYLKNTNAEERELLLHGCLINYYAAKAVN